MVSNTQVMDNQRQQYMHGIPQQPTGSYLPPPPPRPSIIPPPPPGPRPSTLPTGTVFGLPGAWPQNWGRPNMGQNIPPPPPMQGGYRGQNQMNIPPPPPPQTPNQSRYDKPILSATFIPGGDSMGIGVGIPPLEDWTSYQRYEQYTAEPTPAQPTHAYSYQNQAHHPQDITNRDARVASSSSQRPPLPISLRDQREPISPGPLTATLINPQLDSNVLNSHPTSRQRAQSSAVPNTPIETAIQWPIDQVLLWMAQNGFSNDWQETFRILNLEGTEFLDLGRTGANQRAHLAKMHNTIYPQLAKVCSNSSTGWDQSREREEGKRLRKLIARLLDPANEPPTSAIEKHRRRESVLPPASASTEGNVENSPHMRSDFLTTTTSNGQDGSPGMPFAPGLVSRNSQSRSSTLPVFSKQNSASSTPSNQDNNHRTFLNSGVRGRHSPNPSLDSSTGLSAQRGPEASPHGSPGLGIAAPVSSNSSSGQSLRAEHVKSNSTDSSLKATGHSRANLNFAIHGEGLRNRNAPSASPDLHPTGRFYEKRNEVLEHSTASPVDGYLPFYENHTPGPGGREQSKSFLAKFMRKKPDVPHAIDQVTSESPTSPGGLRHMLPPNKSNVNGYDSQRSASAMGAIEEGRMTGHAQHDIPASRRYILATPDYWNYRLIDISDVDTGDALRNLICSQLGISDVDDTHIFTTDPGQMDHDEPLSDDMLLFARSRADNLATIKLYVYSPASTAQSSSTMGNAGLGLVRSHNGHSRHQRPTSLTLQMPSSTGQSSPRLPAIDASPEELQHAAEEYRKQTETKQKAYIESRQKRGDQNTQSAGSGIRGNNIIDFDTPRTSPYDEKRTENLVPMRKPPVAPAVSTTLTKVNSLRTKGTGSGTRSSLDALKRVSDPIAEELGDQANRKRTSGSSATMGIGAALASAGRIAGATAAGLGQIAARGSEDGSAGMNRSPRPSHTWGKGNLLFKVPDYEDEGENASDGHQSVLGKAVNPLLRKLRHNEDNSPAVSPATEHPIRPALTTKKSYGPDFDSKEPSVSFTQSPTPAQPGEDSDDDSDDGLFAVPMANAQSKGGDSQNATAKDVRPTLTVDTDHQQLSKQKNVAFKSPNTADFAPHRSISGDDSAGPSSGNHSGSFSGSTANGSAVSPHDRPGDRRDSFASDIWANRPAVENVVDHLDEFFPGVDLDKPYLEDGGDSATSPARQMDNSVDKTPTTAQTKNYIMGTEGLPLDFSRENNDSDTLGSDESTLKAKEESSIINPAQRQMGRVGGGGLNRMKSIREVAKKHNALARGPSISARAAAAAHGAGSIVRRKSTKMFGASIVEIRPKAGARLRTLDPIPQEEVPSDKFPKRGGTYKIIRGKLIGKGTYGRVYLGMNATTGEFLAVKQVEVNQKATHQDKDTVKKMVQALDREIDTMQHLEHPNIVQYLGCERQEFAISIYLEYIPGGSVGSCLRKHGKFEEPVVKSLTRQTLEGLAYLHAGGILHRDLKADNILLDLDGTCKISDFGISKKSDNIYGNDITNSMQGTVFWMAPEVVRSQGQGYSAKVDIWSLGCVVLEMFHGKRPWSREEAIGAIFKLGSLNEAPPIPDEVVASAGDDGLNFMLDCFQINPDDRPTANDLLHSSAFCIPDLYYNFYDTGLAAKLRTSDTNA